MSLDDSRFATLADALLEHVADAIDDALGDVVEVDLEGGILTLSLPGGGQYIVNKNAPLRQVWLASPVSGAWHFDHRDGQWVSTREPRVALLALLAEELQDRFGVRVAW